MTVLSAPFLKRDVDAVSQVGQGFMPCLHMAAPDSVGQGPVPCHPAGVQRFAAGQGAPPHVTHSGNDVPNRLLPTGAGLRGQRGAALVEFVIVFPILLVLVFAIWEFGRIFDAWLIVTNAAREGARYAIATTNDGTVDTQIQQYLSASYAGRLDSPGGDVTIGLGTYGGCGAASDVIICRPNGASGPVTVAITAHVEVFAPTPFSGFVGPGGTFDVHAWTTMQQ